MMLIEPLRAAMRRTVERVRAGGTGVVERDSDRLVTGVAAGWARRWNVDPTVVRCAIGLLTLAGGLGLVLYGAAALRSVPNGSGRRPSTAPLSASHGNADPVSAANGRRSLAVATGTSAVLICVRVVGLWPGDAVMVPAAGAAVGTAVVWSRDSWRAGLVAHRGRPIMRVAQRCFGALLVGAGVISLASRTGGLGNVGASAGAIAVVLGGIAVVGAPAIGRLLRTLDDERATRIREDERASMAAHLHDSVLQSLVLIQRNSDPRRMVSLARRQERELRSWLYGAGSAPGAPASLHAAIEALTVEIETDHDVRVEAVVVGDQPLDDAAKVLLAALREALVNAARHSGVERVDVFVEADEAELSCYVRDTGCGFDRASVPDDRRGISDSIVGRVNRCGGAAVITSTPGTGTEVELRVPRQR